MFSTYSKIIERLNEHPSSFSHTGTYFHTPLKKSTYDSLLNKADWLVILDQSLKSWDASLRAASEKLYYKENSYRSIGIYSNNSLKFIRGYDTLVKDLGNYLPKEKGIQEIIEATREVNDEGLLSIISHSTNKIFDQNHGKGSLGSAIAAIIYKGKNPNSILVGLDTQLAKEWLSERDDGHLPDLIGINLSDESQSDVTVDIIEVKTYKAFEIDEGHKTIKGDAVNQVSVIEALILEMFSKTEKITTVSRREILREQVYDALFQASFSPKIKREYVVQLNDLFAGKLSVCINMNIYYVNFNEELSAYKQLYKGAGCYKGKNYYLTTLGSQIIQAIVSNSSFSLSMLEEKEAQTTIQLNQANYENNSTIADEADEIEKKAKKTQSPSESDIKESNQAELDKKANHRILEEKCARMNKVLRDFNIHAFPVTVDKVQEATRFTRFKIELKSGETIRSLLKAKEDIGIQLEANGEILIEHIKGTKYISVDVPFVTNNSIISLNEHLELLKSTSGYLNVIAGQAPDGSFEIIDIADAPHMLIAGTTGSGKTVFLQSILVSLLKQFSKDELEVLIIDPKQTDFVFFEDIPHLYGGNIVVDAEEALEKITQINEKDKEVRTKALRSCKSKNIESYNSKNPDNKLKRLVVIIDEYSDLIQAAEMLGTRKEFEKTLLMLLQRVRSLGIHFIIATQRPSAQIVTGALKAVIPFRVSFRLPSHTDSQTILDMSGAENLLGKGDMLMVTETDTKRLQGLYITENELEEFLSTL
ncbi:DNA translocase FtsK [Ruminococcus bicirculans (ex Wegman et al. 2014)]|uniref:DNA translocase FtsK n=1 Tax=Ruminococcus bicirculans (ex Wegman et al. 2014) TaxID=1160721 RepID=UPI003FD8B3BC